MPDTPPSAAQPLLDEGWAVLFEELPPSPAPPDWSGPFERDEEQAIRSFLLEGVSPAMQKRQRRIRESQDIALALMGQTIRNGDNPLLRLVRVGQELHAMDLRTGELLEGGPGELIRERHIVKHLMHQLAANHAVGFVRGTKARQGAEACDWEEPAELGMALTAHSSRLNTDYLEGLRIRARRRARAGLAHARKNLSLAERAAAAFGFRGRYGEKLLTLTMPKIHGATLAQEEARIQRAWQLFRKRDVFRLHVRGYIKGVENAMEGEGPHVHIHALVQATFWDQLEIRECFFSCLNQATFEVHGQRMDKADLEARGVRGGVVVDIRQVRAKGQARNDKEISLEDAIQETIKYVTKPSDLTQLHPEDLWEIELRERFGRMFEVGGACRESFDAELRRLDLAVIRARQKVQKARQAWENSAARHNLGTRLQAVRQELQAPLEDPRSLRAERASLLRELRRMTEAYQERLALLREALGRAQAELEAYRRAKAGTASAEGGSFLDTTCTSDGSREDTEPLLPFSALDRWQNGLGLEQLKLSFEEEKPPPEPRPPSWRQLMHELSFHQWLQVMDQRARSALRFRGRMLRELFEGEFVTLEGRDVVMA